MDNNMMYGILFDLACEYSNYVFTALSFVCDYGMDDDTKKVIDEWHALRNTIVTEIRSCAV